MKRWVAFAGLAAVTLLVAVIFFQGRAGSQAPAEVKKDKYTITVAGTATVKVRPDTARVTFAVQTLAAQVKLAREENSKKVKKISEALNNLKMADLRMKPASEGMELVYSQIENPTQMPEVIGYKVTHLFMAIVKLDDVEKLSGLASQILDTALQSGANFALPIVFNRQEDAEGKRQALAKAVEDALANARAIAGAAKVKIAETVTIDGQPEFQMGQRESDMSSTYVMLGRQQGGESPMTPNEQDVTCRVVVTCSF